MVSILSGHGCFCDVCGSILSLVVLRSPAPQSITPNGPPLHAFGLLHPLAQGSYWRRLNKRPSATLKQQGMQTRRWRSKDTRSLLFRSKESKRLSVLFTECSYWNLVARNRTRALPNGRGWGGMWVLIRLIRKRTDWCVSRNSSIARGTVLAKAEFSRIPSTLVVGSLPSWLGL
jgi:hypothetical protein